MFEEKWYKPKSIEQLGREEKDRQFKQWILDKCKDIVSFVSGGITEYDKQFESNGYMIISAYTKSSYDSCRFQELYKVPIDEFWDCDNINDMHIEKN